MKSISSQSSIHQELKAYFSVNSCVQSLLDLSKQLFDYSFSQNDSFSSHELWTSSKEGIFKIEVYNKDSTRVGLIYMDLYQRDGKFPGACHFTIQCGCEAFSSNDSLTRQYPIVLLSFNFNSTTGLTLHELETLYHEWGHGLHSVLSSTKYQHLSGTRCPVDYAEVPSHLFEYFSRDSRVSTS